MGSDALAGAVTLAVMTAAMAAAIGVVLYWRSLLRLAVRLGRRMHLVRAAAPPRPTGPPIERIAADARRIRQQLLGAPPGIPVARLEGWRRAYDDVLAAGCQALGLEHELDSLPAGPALDAERLRVEVCLERAGLQITSAA